MQCFSSFSNFYTYFTLLRKKTYNTRATPHRITHNDSGWRKECTQLPAPLPKSLTSIKYYLFLITTSFKILSTLTGSKTGYRQEGIGRRRGSKFLPYSLLAMDTIATEINLKWFEKQCSSIRSEFFACLCFNFILKRETPWVGEECQRDKDREF